MGTYLLRWLAATHRWPLNAGVLTRQLRLFRRDVLVPWRLDIPLRQSALPLENWHHIRQVRRRLPPSGWWRYTPSSVPTISIPASRPVVEKVAVAVTVTVPIAVTVAPPI